MINCTWKGTCHNLKTRDNSVHQDLVNIEQNQAMTVKVSVPPRPVFPPPAVIKSDLLVGRHKEFQRISPPTATIVTTMEWRQDFSLLLSNFATLVSSRSQIVDKDQL